MLSNIHFLTKKKVVVHMMSSPAALKRQRDGAALVPVSVSSQTFERSPAFSMGFSMRLVHSPAHKSQPESFSPQ